MWWQPGPFIQMKICFLAKRKKENWQIYSQAYISVVWSFSEIQIPLQRNGWHDCHFKNELVVQCCQIWGNSSILGYSRSHLGITFSTGVIEFLGEFLGYFENYKFLYLLSKNIFQSKVTFTFLNCIKFIFKIVLFTRSGPLGRIRKAES